MMNKADLYHVDDASWLRIAKRYFGEKEIKGTRHNPLIVNFFKNIRAPFSDDETPWCAAFVGSCLEEAHIKSTRSAAALSYRNYGYKIHHPRLGAIAYKTRRNSVGKIVGGHVFFVVGKTKSGNIVGLGGNQNDSVSLASFDPRVIEGYCVPNGYVLPLAMPLFSNNLVNVNTKES